MYRSGLKDVFPSRFSPTEQCLREYTLRFNRRTCEGRGFLFYRLVQNAVATTPVFHKELVRDNDTAWGAYVADQRS